MESFAQESVSFPFAPCFTLGGYSVGESNSEPSSQPTSDGSSSSCGESSNISPASSFAEPQQLESFNADPISKFMEGKTTPSNEGNRMDATDFIKGKTIENEEEEEEGKQQPEGKILHAAAAATTANKMNSTTVVTEKWSFSNFEDRGEGTKIALITSCAEAMESSFGPSEAAYCEQEPAPAEYSSATTTTAFYSAATGSMDGGNTTSNMSSNSTLLLNFPTSPRLRISPLACDLEFSSNNNNNNNNDSSSSINVHNFNNDNDNSIGNHNSAGGTGNTNSYVKMFKVLLSGEEDEDDEDDENGNVEIKRHGTEGTNSSNINNNDSNSNVVDFQELLSPSVVSAVRQRAKSEASGLLNQRKRPPPLGNSFKPLVVITDNSSSSSSSTNNTDNDVFARTKLKTHVNRVLDGDKRSPGSWSNRSKSPLHTINERVDPFQRQDDLQPTRVRETLILASHTVTVSRNGARLDSKKLDTLARSMSVTSEAILADRGRSRSFSEGMDSNSLGSRMLYRLEGFVSNRYQWQPRDWLRQNDEMVRDIIRQAKDVFKSEPRLAKISMPAYVLGDLHGNFGDLVSFGHCFWRQGAACSPANIVFLGDYVDRRNFSVEVVLYLFSQKLQCPSKVFLLRGNHELRDVNSVFGFLDECTAKFGTSKGQKIWEEINDAFDCLPLAGVVGEAIFCVHGGIPGPECTGDVSEIQRIPCPLPGDSDCVLARDLLWSDPQDVDEPSDFILNEERGVAHKFSTRALEKFLDNNDFDFIIRAHQYKVHLGFQVQKKGRLITVFSSSAYCGGQNAASCVLVSDNKLRMMRLDSRSDEEMDRTLPYPRSPSECSTETASESESSSTTKPPSCEWCEERPPNLVCKDCELIFCAICAATVHSKGSLRRHTITEN